MKRCPACKEKTIPYKWVLLGKSEHKNGRCFQCTRCGQHIKKSRWLIIDIFLFNDLTYLALFLLSTIAFEQMFKSFGFALLGGIGFIVAYFTAIGHFSPLREADESYCRGELTKIGAVFALIVIPAIIIFTVYALLIKPLVLGESPFP